jgi:hypothetical protein
MSSERRKQTPWQILTQGIFPVLISAFMMWVGSEVVELKITIAEMKAAQATVQTALELKQKADKDETIRNALRHHRDESLGCTGCHVYEDIVRDIRKEKETIR